MKTLRFHHIIILSPSLPPSFILTNLFIYSLHSLQPFWEHEMQQQTTEKKEVTLFNLTAIHVELVHNIVTFLLLVDKMKLIGNYFYCVFLTRSWISGVYTRRPIHGPALMFSALFIHLWILHPLNSVFIFKNCLNTVSNFVLNLLIVFIWISYLLIKRGCYFSRQDWRHSGLEYVYCTKVYSDSQLWHKTPLHTCL